MLALRDAFPGAKLREVRRQMVSIAASTGGEAALEILNIALDDEESCVWQEALDGLVSIGGPTSVCIVSRALENTLEDGRREYLAEAVEQLREGVFGETSQG